MRPLAWEEKGYSCSLKLLLAQCVGYASEARFGVRGVLRGHGKACFRLSRLQEAAAAYLLLGKLVGVLADFAHLVVLLHPG